MVNINNFLVENNLKSEFIRFKSALTYSFIVGLFLGSLPFIHKTQEKLRVQKLIQEQRNLKIIQ